MHDLVVVEERDEWQRLKAMVLDSVPRSYLACLVMPFRVRPLFVHKNATRPRASSGCARNSGFDKYPSIRQRSTPLESITVTVGVQTASKRLNQTAWLLDMCRYRKEIIVDKAGDFLVGVRLGLQPSASASSGSRAEIEQKRFIGGLSRSPARRRRLVTIEPA